MSIEALLERDFDVLLKHSRDHVAEQLEHLDKAIAGDEQARELWRQHARTVLAMMEGSAE